jgi:cyclophilin family peptidyl-prolyl cis-trans isomerase
MALSEAMAQIEAFIAEQKIDTGGGSWKTSLPMPPVASFGDGKTYSWNLETNVGNISVNLMPEVAPMHVTSTIYLTTLGFYDDVPFHRVITDFMAQGGDPLGRGTGGPGYQYDGEFDPTVKHDRPGLLSMANAGPGTDGSQFFLTFVETPWLDGKHTIFGAVVDGMDTVKALEARGSGSGQTSEPLVIVKATVSVA